MNRIIPTDVYAIHIEAKKEPITYKGEYNNDEEALTWTYDTVLLWDFLR